MANHITDLDDFAEIIKTQSLNVLGVTLKSVELKNVKRIQ